MPTVSNLVAFTLVSLGLVLTPGPNMIYLISRSISQGRRAGFISLGGVALGYVFYMVCAALGVTAILMAVPFAHDALRLGGAAYLLYIAWRAIKPGGNSLFEARDLPIDPASRLFGMGFLTNLLNPKIALMYLSLLPQFISVERGEVLSQSLVLGTVQIVISIVVNAGIAVAAGTIAGFMAERPTWAMAQRWLMATVLGAMAVRLATEVRRA